jgi:hypothetical protein
MEVFHLQKKNTTTPVVMLHLRPSAMDILVTENRKLVLANTFPYRSDEDVLYYTLNVYEQLRLNPETEQLTVAGISADMDVLTILLSKYIRNVAVATRLPVASYSYVFDELPSSAYYHLFSQVLCVS